MSRRPRTFWTFAGVAAVTVAALAAVGMAGSAAHVRRVGDPRRPYETSVNPGTGIQFVYPRTLFALSGQPLNTLDGGLTAPDGLSVTWPSPSVLVSRDGGRSWRASLSAPAGVWGFSFGGFPLAFAVGVNALYRSRDDGRRWRRIREPSQALVRVAVLGGNEAAGLTTDGRMVMTATGGSSWQAARWGGTGRALCAVGGGVLVADQRGAVWGSKDPGYPFTEKVAGLTPGNGDGPWWVDLSCGVNNAVEFLQAFPEAAGAAAITIVRQSTDGGFSWRRVTQITNGAVNEEAPLPAEAVAVGSRTLCVFSYPRAPTIDAECTSDGGRSFRLARTPRMPRCGYQKVRLQGVSFVGPADGWLEIVRSAAGAHAVRYQAEVWATDDAGASWRVAYAGPSRRVPLPR